MGVLRKYSASAVLINKECLNVRPFQGQKHMKSQHVATHKNDSGLLGFHQCNKPLVYSRTGASIKILKIERKDTWSHLRQLMTQYIICYWYISFKFVLVLLDNFIISLISGLAISGHVQISWSERNLAWIHMIYQKWYVTGLVASISSFMLLSQKMDDSS